MPTDIDLVFDQLRAAVEAPLPTASEPRQAWRIPHRPLALLLEDEMRRRARFLDSGHAGPEERWPLATPGHLLDELEVIAKRLKRAAGIQHMAALRRVARVAGYADWEHARRERDAFEASAGDAFRDGLVVAVSDVAGAAQDFIQDDGLLFLAARDLVHEFSQVDDEGSWGQLCTPTTLDPGEPNVAATRQMFLGAIGASYWRPSGCALFLRYQGKLPQDLAAAQALVAAQLGTGGVHYIWHRGQMHTVRPLWD